MAEEKLIRLSQAARKLNVGHNTILDFLGKKGFEVENTPTLSSHLSNSQFCQRNSRRRQQINWKLPACQLA
jgi:translation initiation factor IF-2